MESTPMEKRAMNYSKAQNQDCTMTINFPDEQTLKTFAYRIDLLSEYLMELNIEGDERKEIEEFQEKIKEARVSSPLIDGGHSFTIYGMHIYLFQGLYVDTPEDYMDHFYGRSNSLQKEAN